MKNDRKKSEKMLRAVGGIGSDLVNEASAPRSHAGRRKLIIALIAAVLAITMIAGSAVLIAAYVKKNSAPSLPDDEQNGNGSDLPDAKPISLSGNAYKNDAQADLPECLESIDVTVDGSSSRMISPSAVFTVKTAGKCDVETLEDYLTLTPASAMSYKQVDDTTFEIAPASGTLVPGTVYKLTLGDPANPASSYAFQTDSELIVRNFLPGDKSIGAPVDTGIEITFSESVKNCDFSEYIKISPQIAGRFMLYPDGRTVAFIPREELAFDAVYTVSVSGGIEALSGKTLKDEARAVFRTAAKDDGANGERAEIYLSVDGSDLTSVFSSGDSAFTRFHCSAYDLDRFTVKATLYRFAGYADAYRLLSGFIQSDGQTDALPFDLSELQIVTELTQSASNQLNDAFVFGSGLDKGVYFVRITAEGKAGGKTIVRTAYSAFQISELRKFTLSSDGKTLLWVNHVKTGVVGGAQITGKTFTKQYGWSAEVSGKTYDISGTTGGDGVFTFENNENSASLLYIKKGDDELIASVATSAESQNNYYFKYLYTDREVYFSNDVVNFEGMIAPAYGAKLPDELYVQTALSQIKQKVTLREDGSFSGSFAIEDSGACSVYVRIVDENGVVYVSKYIRVTLSEKPLITASISFDRPCWRLGDTVSGKLKAAFFDGTPAEGFDFALSCYTFDYTSDTKTTDKNGEIAFSFKTTLLHNYGTDPISVTVYAELNGMETQTLSVRGSTTYFNSDYLFDIRWEKDFPRITINEVDLTDFPENYIGKPAEKPVSVTLMKVTYVKKAVTKYDTFTKKNVTYYEYNSVRTQVSSEILTSFGGVIDLPLYTVSGFEGYYYYDIFFNDGNLTYDYSIGATKYDYGTYDRTPHIEAAINTDKDAYAIGDAVKAQVEYGAKGVKTALYAVFANGLEEHFVGSEFNGIFKDGYIPGASLYAVFYSAEDGKYVYVRADLPYDWQANAVSELEILPDKQIYKPGDTAKVKIRVKNASGGWALISVVDEACFALGDQKLDPAKQFFTSLGTAGSYSNFYRDYYYYYYGRRGAGTKPVYVNSSFALISVYESSERDAVDKNASGADYAPEADFEANSPTPGIDEGGDEGVYIRKYFADNPEFKVVTLNGDGEGLLTFTVPDNITSWRLSAFSVSGLSDGAAKIRIGSTVSDIVCTQAFFINPSLSKTYIVGDDAAFSARSFGTAAEGKVRYKAQLFGEDGTVLKELTAESDALKNAYFNFGKLGKGSYTVRITGQCGTERDAVESVFQVVETNAVVNVRRDVTANELKSISPALYPVTVTFSDVQFGNGVWRSAADRLLWAYGDDRCDVIAARYTANLAYARLFGFRDEEELDVMKDLLAKYVSGGAFRLFTYAGEDDRLNAQMLALDKDLLPADKREACLYNLRQRLSAAAQTDRVDLCACLASLAALDEPLLDTLYAVADQAGEYPLEAKLYLAAAFALIGDYSAANDIYRQEIEKNCTRNTENGTLHVNAATQSEKTRLTSLALFTVSRISKKDAEMMARYILGNYSNDERGLLGLASYVKYYMPTEKLKEQTITVKIAGEEKTFTLRPGSSYSLVLGKRDLESFEAVRLDENVKITVFYKGAPSDSTENAKQSDRLKITKTLKMYKNNVCAVTLRIEGKSTRVYESFDLNDTIPSGARYLGIYRSGYSRSSVNGIDAYASISNTSGQRLTGWMSIYNRSFAYSHDGAVVSETPEYSFSIEVTYLIRGAVEGEFVSESAMIRDRSGSYALSDRSLVVIEDGKNWAFKAA